MNLRNPGLVTFEILLTVLALIWLYLGLSDYMFVSKLKRSIKVARTRKKDLEKSISA